MSIQDFKFRGYPKPRPFLNPNEINGGAPFKIHIFAESNNTILLRVANLNDRFDKDWDPKLLNLTLFAMSYYRESNIQMSGVLREIDPRNIKIIETTLTGT